jgi:hypothetical protein
MKAKQTDQHPAMQCILSGLRREHRLKVGCALALLLLGLVFIYAFFTKSIILSVFGLICAVLGLRFCFHLISNWNVANSRLMILLHFHPKEIVWVYSVVTEQLPFGFQLLRNGTLYFKLRDGDDISVSLSTDDLKAVSKYLNDLLPHATFGYTKDREQWFMASPLMLLREEGEGR